MDYSKKFREEENLLIIPFEFGHGPREDPGNMYHFFLEEKMPTICPLGFNDVFNYSSEYPEVEER